MVMLKQSEMRLNSKLIAERQLLELKQETVEIKRLLQEMRVEKIT